MQNAIMDINVLGIAILSHSNADINAYICYICIVFISSVAYLSVS